MRSALGKYIMDFYNILLAKKVHYAIGLMNFGIGRRSATSWTIVERKAGFFPQRILLWKARFLSLLFQLVKAVLSLWIFLVPRVVVSDDKESHVFKVRIDLFKTRGATA